MTKKEFLEIPGVKTKLDELAKKYEFTVDEILSVIKKESNFDTKAENPKSKATGLIQFMPDTAKGLNTSIDEIAEMDAIAQLDLIDKYFEQNHTKGEHPYITVAYPKAATMGMDDIIADSDSIIAKQNPVWQDENGNVTKRSILGYVKKGEEKGEEEGETYVDPEETKGEGRQTQIVYDANDNPIEIPIGEDVTEYELREKQTGGEQRFKSWKELEDNIDKFDKSRPFYIGENRYKWNEEKQKVLLVDEKGEYLPDDRQRENEQFQDIFKGDRVEVKGGTLEGKSPKEMVEDSIINPPVESATEEVVEEEPIIGAEQKPDVGLDRDNDGIPDTIDIDGGEGTNIPISGTQDVEQEPKKRTTGEMINQAVNVVGSAGESILGGAGKVLDALGGPSAIISYVMGKKGLEAAMKEVTPMESPQLSPLFHQHLRQSKELAKRGFHPKEAQQFRSQLDNAYQRGIENAVRGSAGQRARFLAQSGVLDSQRSSALLDFAAKDAELQRKNQETYTDQMLFKENFDLQRSDKLRTEDMQRQLADKEAASKFTATAFSNLMNNIGGGNTALIKQMLKSFQGGTGSTDLSSGL
jgi:hypothetical protein